MQRVIFLFNHDAAHQVAHLAGVAARMAALHPEVRSVIACATPEIRRSVEAAFGDSDIGAAEWVDLVLPRWVDRLCAPLNKLIPIRRLLRLKMHAELFGRAAMIVSTERTCLRLKGWIKGRMPRFAIIPHGAGDRNVSYHPDFARFDLVLVAGQKVVEAMQRIGVAAERLRLVGYPKFDSVARQRPAATTDAPSADARPLFVYNPHFDPHLSSWYREGPKLLRWFASEAGQAYRLIFAPHVMLFRKRVHISPEYKVARVRPDIPAEALSAPNISIDVDSPALFDMTHMLAADAYIGDMSSQIYEFLLHPRAAYFLDVHRGLETEPEDQHLHWRAGPVFASADDLVRRLPEWQAIAADYLPAQRALFDWTFDQSDARGANARAADAIAAYVREISEA